MSRIYISKETIEKLYETTRLSKESKSLIDKFDPQRKNVNKKPKQNLPLLNTANKTKTKTSSQIKNEARRARRKMKRAKAIEERKALEEAKLQRVREISERASLQPVGFSLSIKKQSSRARSSHTKTKPLINSKNNDAYNFAGEYSARNVEFGHGRQKSQEWNIEAAKSLRAELEHLKKLHHDDPNTFDRGAMK